MRQTMEHRITAFSQKYRVSDNGCWEWRAGKVNNGYGVFWNGLRTTVAHRWAYEYFVGQIPVGLELDHLCRNRACVNPEHLEPVTHRENGLRGNAGMHRVEEAKSITRCPNGHLFDIDNTGTGYNPNLRTYRVCRTCKREARRVYYEKNATEINAKKRLNRLNRRS